MRTALLVVVCVLLAIAAWIGWSSQRASLQASRDTEAIAAAPLESGTTDAHVLAPPEASEPVGRASASSTEGTITTFHVIDASSGADIERFALRVESVRDADEPAGSARLERHSQGRVRVLHPPGAEISIIAPGYDSVRSRAQPDEAGTQTLRMHRAAGIEGRVTLAGRPAAGVKVFAQNDFTTIGAGTSYAMQVRQYPRQWSEHETDDAGRFLVMGVAPGNYALRFEGEGAAHVLRRGIIVPPELSVDIGEVVLVGEAIVRGSIVPPADQSPSIITVMLDNLPQVGAPPSTVDFEFRGLSAGTHELIWMRGDGGDTRVALESRRTRIELQAGEVREVTVDATGGETSKLTVHVRVNGLPAARRYLRASTDLERGSKHGSWTTQATTDASGTGVMLLTPGQRFRIDVLGATLRVIGRSAEPIELAPGEERELTLDLALGTVVVRLPSSLELPQSGRITLHLWDAQGNTLNETASRLLDLKSSPERPVWTSNQIEFGACPVGEFNARVGVERVVKATSGAESFPYDLQLLRPSFDAKITIVAGRETMIVVPE